MTSQSNSNPEAGQQKHEMHFLEHLAELRKRLIYTVIAVGLAAAAAFTFSGIVFDLLAQPYYTAFPANSLIGTGPAEAFLLKLKAAVFSGALLASPVIFFQIWCFIAPGLYPQEKKLLIPFVLSSTLLFLTGALFCYKVVFAFAFQFFFEQYKSIGLNPTVRLSEHVSLIMTAIVGFGVVFETPVLAFFLARFGILDHKMLLKFGRHAVIVIFILSAALTPPDVLTQFLMAGPLIGLYLISILIVKWAYQERSSDSDSALTDEAEKN